MLKNSSAAAIVPAFNEAATIGLVVEALKEGGLFDEIIVVDDGSEDSTARIARLKGAKVIELKENQGKGRALAAGVRATQSPVLLFVDADLQGLSPRHLRMLLEPVLAGRLDMNIGFIVRRRFRIIARLYQGFKAPLSGTRALRRELWEMIPQNKLLKRWEPESVLNHLAKKHGFSVSSVQLTGIKHIIKEQKWGLWSGLYWRLRMIGRIAILLIWLKFRI
jgi:glycosyltransferase involved in cell wall biosynthesis